MKKLIFTSALFFCVLFANAQLTITYDTLPFCNFNNYGGVCVVVTGGTPPYQYAWSHGDITACLYGVTLGTYSVTVNDANGLTAATTITITSTTPFNPVVHVKTNFIPETCNDSDGMIWFEITGGAPPYNIQLYADTFNFYS